MKNTARKLIVYIGAVILALTMIIFFVGFGINHKETIDYLALIFILISEVVVFISANFMVSFYDYRNKTFVFSGAIGTLFLYMTTTILLSIFSNVLFYKNYNGFITVQLIIIAIASIFLISFFVIGFGIIRSSEKVNSDSMILQQCENKVFSLKSNNEYEEISDSLNNLYEEIRFSDKSEFILDKEDDISSMIDELSNNMTNYKNDGFNKEELVDQINKIIVNVKERNYQVKQLKRR